MIASPANPTGSIVREDELRNIGCAKGQGWHYGRPLSIEQIGKVLAERNLLPPKPGIGLETGKTIADEIVEETMVPLAEAERKAS